MTRFLTMVVAVVVLVALTHLATRPHVVTVAADSSPAVTVTRVLEPLHVPRVRPHRCTARNWKQRLKPAERWIDLHESGLNPDEHEPTTGAEEIGQLLPSTLANLGLTFSPDPCVQIRHQRIYMHERYVTWTNALNHWYRYRWW